MIIAIDFDNTIVKSDYPIILGMLPNARTAISALYDAGHTIIINTCRVGKHLDVAVSYLKEHGIKYHYINENVPGRIKEYGGDCRKISCDVLIDDKAYPFVKIDWVSIYMWFVNRGWA